MTSSWERSLERIRAGEMAEARRLEAEARRRRKEITTPPPVHSPTRTFSRIYYTPIGNVEQAIEDGWAEGLGRAGQTLVEAMEAYIEPSPVRRRWVTWDDVPPEGWIDGVALRKRIIERLRLAASRKSRTTAWQRGCIYAYNDAVEQVDKLLNEAIGEGRL